ncbi:MAG: hypothetical protein V4461_11100 [Pseudomonadota bacterium]|tara:strand:- start:695 stop:1279 length:585 start_codon:yes stop_codon:yes gene_type:complete
MRGSLTDLVSMAGMPSEPTLRKMIAENPDFPVLARGKNGVAYEFDLAAAALFVRGIREREEQIARARSEEVRQFGLQLLGEDSAATQEQIGLSPSERKALLEEELIAIKVAERRGDLIRKSSVEEALGTLLIWFQGQGKSFTARLAKRHDVPRDLLVAIDAMIEQDQRELADRMERIADIAKDVSPGAADDTAV